VTKLANSTVVRSMSRQRKGRILMRVSGPQETSKENFEYRGTGGQDREISGTRMHIAKEE
jgi:hypothetical protein